MRKLILIASILVVSSCGYHLRNSNSLFEKYPQIHIVMTSQSLLKRPLVNALLSSGVRLSDKNVSDKNMSDENKSSVSELKIVKDSLRKVIQSIGVNNQVQEYRLEYDVELSIGGSKTKTIHLEKDYSFDIQQIGGGQQEEQTLRKQLADDMAWAIIRQIDAIKVEDENSNENSDQD